MSSCQTQRVTWRGTFSLETPLPDTPFPPKHHTKPATKDHIPWSLHRDKSLKTSALKLESRQPWLCTHPPKLDPRHSPLHLQFLSGILGCNAYTVEHAVAIHLVPLSMVSRWPETQKVHQLTPELGSHKRPSERPKHQEVGARAHRDEGYTGTSIHFDSFI